MFNRILVPTDGSPYAHAALETALHLATVFDSALVALHVVDIRLIEGPMLQSIGSLWGDVPYPVQQADVTETLQARGREILDAVEKRVREEGRPVETALETGLVGEIIVDRARSVDLVVLGRRGEHAQFGDAPLGSTVNGVVRRSPRPVLVCAGGHDPLERVLAAYDGSEHAARALEIGVEYAERRAAPLHVVTVQHSREEAQRILDEALDFAGGHSVTPTAHAREGDAAADLVLEVAREVGADLLVMGAYGRGRLREFLVGSTTETILTRFEHPILLYR